MRASGHRSTSSASSCAIRGSPDPRSWCGTRSSTTRMRSRLSASRGPAGGAGSGGRPERAPALQPLAPALREDAAVHAHERVCASRSPPPRRWTTRERGLEDGREAALRELEAEIGVLVVRRRVGGVEAADLCEEVGPHEQAGGRAVVDRPGEPVLEQLRDRRRLRSRGRRPRSRRPSRPPGRVRPDAGRAAPPRPTVASRAKTSSSGSSQPGSTNASGLRKHR